MIEADGGSWNGSTIDAAPEVLALARRRVGDLPVQLALADLFDWRPPRRGRAGRRAGF